MEKLSLKKPVACEYCGKEFRNAQALGGHKSKVHMKSQDILGKDNWVRE